jgi:hypothetical protein
MSNIDAFHNLDADTKAAMYDNMYDMYNKIERTEQAIKALKDTYKHIDLYGSEVFLTQLKKHFNRVSYTNKTIPGPGSPCKPADSIAVDLKVERAIFHDNNEVTVFTQHGNLRFWKL